MKKVKMIIIGLVVILVVAAVVGLLRLTKNDHLSFGTDPEIDVTPTQIVSIKAIGEWEFLSVSLEELTDTVRKGFFSDDELARIYYGTLRLGINMHQVEPGWLTAEGDSVSLLLPKVALIDRDFIDEARTKPFFESGKWKPEDREALYRQARERMLQHGMTKENLTAAEDNAREQITSLMKAMGFKKVRIAFGSENEK